MMTNCTVIPRLRSAEKVVDSIAGALPVVVLRGARQVGKSTLARAMAERDGRVVVSFDDPRERAAFRADEDAFVQRAMPMVIDEAQRELGVMLALKRAVDAMGTSRVRGRYLVTGSADLLLLPGVADSLTGRAGYGVLWPLTRRERLGMGETGRWSLLFDHPASRWPEVLADGAGHADDWRATATRGVMPEPALLLDDPDARAIWQAQYVSTWLDRDLRELTQIEQSVDMLRLMQAAALRVGSLVNQTDLGRDVQMPQQRVARYLNVLELAYQVIRVRSFGPSRTHRLSKAPKLYWIDPALAMHLSGQREPTGAHLENLVLLELLAWIEEQHGRAEVGYWRTSTGHEVDFVLARGRQVVPIEVKASRSVTTRDLRGMQAFLDAHRDRAPGGVVLTDGERIESVGSRIWAVPWWMLA